MKILTEINTKTNQNILFGTILFQIKKIILKIQIVIDNSSLELHLILFQIKYFDFFWY